MPPFGLVEGVDRAPPEELAAALRSYAAAGVSHVQLWLEPNPREGLEAFAPTLELLYRG